MGVGNIVGACDGPPVGENEGALEGAPEGAGVMVGETEGAGVGAKEGENVGGYVVGDRVGAIDGIERVQMRLKFPSFKLRGL